MRHKRKWLWAVSVFFLSLMVAIGVNATPAKPTIKTITLKENAPAITFTSTADSTITEAIKVKSVSMDEDGTIHIKLEKAPTITDYKKITLTSTKAPKLFDIFAVTLANSKILEKGCMVINAGSLSAALYMNQVNAIPTYQVTNPVVLEAEGAVSDYDKSYPTITALKLTDPIMTVRKHGTTTNKDVKISCELKNFDLTEEDLKKDRIQAGEVIITPEEKENYNYAFWDQTKYTVTQGTPSSVETYVSYNLSRPGTFYSPSGSMQAFEIKATRRDNTIQTFYYPVRIVSDAWLVEDNAGEVVDSAKNPSELLGTYSYDSDTHTITYNVTGGYKKALETCKIYPYYAVGAEGVNAASDGSFTGNAYKGFSFDVKNGTGNLQKYNFQVKTKNWPILVYYQDGTKDIENGFDYKIYQVLDDGKSVDLRKYSDYVGCAANLNIEAKSVIEVQVTPPEGMVLDTVDLKTSEGTDITYSCYRNTFIFEMPEDVVKVGALTFKADTETKYQIETEAKMLDDSATKEIYVSSRVNNTSVQEACEGDLVVLKAEADDQSYYDFVLDHWEYDKPVLIGAVEDEEASTLSFRMPKQKVNVKAVYKYAGTKVTLGVEPTSAAGELYVTTNNSKVISTSEKSYTDTYKTGISLTLTLRNVESQGYKFKGWQQNGIMVNSETAIDGVTWNNGVISTKDGSGIEYQYPTVTLSDESVEWKAVFESKATGFVKVSSSDETMGTVSAKVGDDTITDDTIVYEGMEVTLTATPKKGHQFENWEVVTADSGVTLADSNMATTTFTMPDTNKDVEIRANFAVNPNWKNDECDLTGAYILDGEGKVIKEADRSGTTFTFTFTKTDLSPEEAGKLDMGGYYLKLDVSKGASVKCGSYDDKDGTGKYSEGTVANTIGKNSSEEITVTSQDGNNQSKYTIAVVYDTTPLVNLVSAERTSDTEAKVSFKSDTSGTYYYMYKKSTESDPKKEDVLASSLTGSISAGSEKTLNLKSLKAEEAYRVYIVVKGSDGAVSDMLIAELPTLGAYSVKLSYPQSGGTLSVDKTRANEGETVTVTVTPKTGKKLDTLNYSSSDSAAGKVEITEKTGENTYTFTMPNYNISIGCTWTDATQESGPAIISFVVNGVNGVINESAGTISIVLPYGTDLTSLKPVITLNGATSVSPASGETVNLSGPVTYTVTGEDGTTKTYKVTAVTSEQPKSDKLWESMLEQTGGSTDHTGKNTWWKKAKDMKKHNDYPKYW